MDGARVSHSWKSISHGDLLTAVEKHERFLARRQGGRRALLSSRDLDNQDLSGRNLSDADLTGVRLRRALLSKTMLQSAILVAADLRMATLNEANLRGADLRGACLRGALLNNANLSGADFRDARVAVYDEQTGLQSNWLQDIQTDLSSAEAHGTDFTGAHFDGAFVLHADLADAVMRGVDLKGADLKNANLTGAILENADLSDAKLSGAKLSAALLTGAIVQGADLKGADLTDAIVDPALLRSRELEGVALPTYARVSDADLHGMLASHEAWIRSNGSAGTRCCLPRVDLSERSLRGLSLAVGMLKAARLQHSDLTNAILASCDLTMADLRGVKLVFGDLRGVKLQRAHLQDADLSSANLGPLCEVGSMRHELASDLRYAKFHRARLCGADLQRANLTGADFSQADLRDADLRSATLDDADFTGANLQGAKLAGARCHHTRGLAFDQATGPWPRSTLLEIPPQPARPGPRPVSAGIDASVMSLGRALAGASSPNQQINVAGDRAHVRGPTADVDDPEQRPAEHPDTAGRHVTDQVKAAAPKPHAGEERRKHRRKKCLLPARLVTPAGSYDVRVLDLSPSGAKIDTSAILTPEQPVTLVAEPIGTFNGVVAWCDDGCFGMRFLDQQAGASVGTAPGEAALIVPETSVPHPGSDAGPPSQMPQGNTAPQATAAPERPFVLCYGDVICLLRKRQALEATGKAVVGDLANCKFVEIDAGDLTELARQEAAVTVAFLRVAPLA